MEIHEMKKRGKYSRETGGHQEVSLTSIRRNRV